MNPLLTYSGLTTKVRAMEHHLLNQDDYLQLINLSSISELVSYLQAHPVYSHIFEGVETMDLHRGNLEQLLFLSQYETFGKLYNFSTMTTRKFLKLYFIRYEIHLLKQVIREIQNGQSLSLDFEGLELYFQIFSDINLNRIASATTMQDVIDALQGSKFYEGCFQVYSLPEKTLFDYELCLDLFFFSSMWKGKDKYMKGRDLEIITMIYGTSIDILNLQWIYRIKKYYQVSKADIYAMIIPIHYKLKTATVKQLVEQELPPTLGEFLMQTPYSKFSIYSDSISLETIYDYVLEHMHQKLKQKYPYSLASVAHFLYNKQSEITKLINITECIRYGHSTSETQKMIFGGEILD